MTLVSFEMKSFFETLAKSFLPRIGGNDLTAKFSSQAYRKGAFPEAVGPRITTTRCRLDFPAPLLIFLLQRIECLIDKLRERVWFKIHLIV